MHIEGMGNPEKTRATPMKAIKFFCLECQGGASYTCQDVDGKPIKKYSPHKEVRECSNDECWLYPYRTGYGPKRVKTTG